MIEASKMKGWRVKVVHLRPDHPKAKNGLLWVIRRQQVFAGGRLVR